MQKRISLKFSSHNTGANVSGHESVAGGNTPTHNHSQQQRVHTSESPSKRIFLGEFDEMNDLTTANNNNKNCFNFGDELLLSTESPLKKENEKFAVASENVFDFNDYIT